MLIVCKSLRPGFVRQLCISIRPRSRRLSSLCVKCAHTLIERVDRNGKRQKRNAASSGFPLVQVRGTVRGFLWRAVFMGFVRERVCECVCCNSGAYPSDTHGHQDSLISAVSSTDLEAAQETHARRVRWTANGRSTQKLFPRPSSAPPGKDSLGKGVPLAVEAIPHAVRPQQAAPLLGVRGGRRIP